MTTGNVAHPGGAGLPDDNQGPAILAASGTMTLLALATLIARLYVRISMVKNVGWDDYVILLTMTLSLTGLVIVIISVTYGAGRHLAYLDPPKASLGLKYNFVSQPIYLWAIAFVKISIGLFLLRIAPTKTYRRFVIGVMVFMGVYTTICFFTIMFQCSNLAILWNPTVKAKCFAPRELRALSYLNVSLNISTDLIFSALPAPMIWRVQITKRTKMTLVGIMSLGIFACAAASVKTSYLGSYGKTGDFLWDSAPLTIWTVTECNVGIIAANLPCLKPLFKRILDKTSRYSSSRNNKSDGAYFTHGTSRSTTRKHNNSDRDVHGGDSHMMTQMSGRGANHAPNADNISEESVLPLRGIDVTNSDAGIVKTTVVQVQSVGMDEGRSREGNDEEGKNVWLRGNGIASVPPQRKVEDWV